MRSPGRAQKRPFPLAFVLIAAAANVVACGAVERAAANDPVKCERDPNCASKQGKSRDCATSCSDNIECMERCQQINGRK